MQERSDVSSRPLLETGPNARIPIVLGVTGHRDLGGPEQKSALRREVEAAMRRLRERYPSSPFAILSPLAKGADRLVAGAALEVLGASLHVPLPLPEKLYREDFSSRGTGEFDRLLGEADSAYELALLSSRADVAERGQDRARQYALAGGFVTDRSQILFALWDGKEAGGTGGTGEVARWAMKGQVPPEHLPPEARDRPFYYPSETDLVHVHTETAEAQYRSGESPAEPVLERIERYNEEIQDLKENWALKETLPLPNGSSGQSAIERSIRGVAGEAEAGPLVSAAGQDMLHRYGAADALSIKLQSRFKRRLALICGLSGLGVAGFAAIEVWAPGTILSLSCAALGLLLLWHLYRQELEDRYLHARALAEGLRVGLFWSVAGVEHHVHDHYLSKQAGEMAWTRVALQNVETTSRTPSVARRPGAEQPGATVSQATSGGTDTNKIATGEDIDPDGDASAPEGLLLTEREWVGAQLRYYREAQAEVNRSARRLNGGAKAAYGVSLALAVGAAGYIAFAPGWQSQTVEYVGMAIELALALGVSLQAYRSKLGLGALGRHYETARQLFKEAREALRRGDQRPRAVLRRLGQEALAENGEWLWMNQSRDVDAPTVA